MSDVERKYRDLIDQIHLGRNVSIFINVFTVVQLIVAVILPDLLPQDNQLFYIDFDIYKRSCSWDFNCYSYREGEKLKCEQREHFNFSQRGGTCSSHLAALNGRTHYRH